MVVDGWMWLRRHALDVVAIALGAASGSCAVLFILQMVDNEISGWLAMSAVGLGIAAFACIAASGFLEASRQIRMARAWDEAFGRPPI